MLYEIILAHSQCIFHHSQYMLDKLKLAECLFVAGAVLGWMALWAARGPYSGWLARLPGTLAHEFAHYFVALVTFSSPSSMSLRLKRIEGGWELGSIDFRPGFWTAGLVALAPGWILPLCIYGLWREAAASSATYNLVAGYVAMTFAYGAVPSRSDWGIAIRYPIGMLIAFAVTGAALWAAFLGKG